MRRRKSKMKRRRKSRGYGQKRLNYNEEVGKK